MALTPIKPKSKKEKRKQAVWGTVAEIVVGVVELVVEILCGLLG